MKKFRKLAFIVLTVLALFLLFGLWYKYTYSMNDAEAYEVNTPNLDRKLLIAAQGSDFKNTVVQGVVDYYKSDSVYIKIIDISSLPEIDLADFDAVVLMHTWEYGQPPEIISTFMESADSFKDKMVVLTTSGEGDEKMEGIDAITGESIVEDVPLFVEKIISRLDPLLRKAN